MALPGPFRGGGGLLEDLLQRGAKLGRLERAPVDRRSALALHDVEHVLPAAALVQQHLVLVDPRVGAADPDAVRLVRAQRLLAGEFGGPEPVAELRERLLVLDGPGPGAALV